MVSREVSWPSEAELRDVRKTVSDMAGRGPEEVRIVVCPYRICPLGAHIDHQGGFVSSMTINKGIILGFIPSADNVVLLCSREFVGKVRFRIVDVGKNAEDHETNSLHGQQGYSWGNFARGAVYALRSRGNILDQGFTGYMCGSPGLDGVGLSSSAAVGVAYLLALESANNITVSPAENIEYDRVIENEYLGLNNGILDQSAILLASYGCLMCIDCKTKEYNLVHSCILQCNKNDFQKSCRILLAFSGLRNALINSFEYNHRVAECQLAARVLLEASGNDELQPILSNVELESYEMHKDKLEGALAKRAEHYFAENIRVSKGIHAWSSGDFEEFGKLMSASGLSSIRNYECGCEPLIQLREILLRAPGVFGARFCGAGFRGCCLAFVAADRAAEAACFVERQYRLAQPELARQISPAPAVLICGPGDCARVI